MKRNNPDTSIAAFKSLQSEDMKAIYTSIINALGVLKTGTFEDISKHIKCSPPKVWRRLSELDEKYGLIYRPGGKKKLKSGREGYVWALTLDGKKIAVTFGESIPGKTIADHSRAISKITASLHEERII